MDVGAHASIAPRTGDNAVIPTTETHAEQVLCNLTQAQLEAFGNVECSEGQLIEMVHHMNEFYIAELQRYGVARGCCVETQSVYPERQRGRVKRKVTRISNEESI